MPAARRARQYRGIVVDLRLFRMRSDRDAINNDALTDPMAGGRPHESHDLTFAWVGCPRPIARARARVSPREPIAMQFLRASAREKRESNFKCNDYRHHRCADLARALRTFAFSPHTRLLWSLPPSPNRLFTFSDVSTSPYFLENYCLMFRSVARTQILARHDTYWRTLKSRKFFIINILQPVIIF